MKISIIVPIYNAEQYLKKCISSVMSQTYSNWELILINDGSTDGSSNIINMMAETDDRIIAIHQENMGPGKTRNRGIERATGEYIVFLDSDDFLDKDYLGLLVEKAERNDIVFIDVNQITTEGRVLAKEKMSKYKKWSKERILRSQMTGKIPWGGVRKAVSIKLLRDNNIGFTTHSVGEEALYSFCILYAAETIGFLDEKPVYFYVNHENSQSKLRAIDPLGNVVMFLREYLQQQNLYLKFADTVNAFNLTATIISLDRIAQMYKGKEMVHKAEDRIMQFKASYDNNVGLDFRNMSYKAKIFAPFLKFGIYRPVILASNLRKCMFGI